MKTIEIINHFGFDNQLGKLKEECLELIEVIDGEEFVLDNLIDELADVKLLIKQIEEYLDIAKKVGARFHDKYKRTLKRIESGYYETN